MLTPNFTDPQFVDANGVGGLNAAFQSIASSLSSAGSGQWGVPGLISPEATGLSFVGLVGTVNLPAPWGLITSGGTFVQAHGALSGQNTTSYSVNFASVIPATGSVTAYCVATPTQIQQNPFPIPGPPPGHPSFNPDFMPTVGYATVVDSVALTATITPPDNATTFEVFRTTLTAAQSSITTFSTVGWFRAAVRKTWPSYPANVGAGLLTAAQAQFVLSPTGGGLTCTLPSLSGAGGLVYMLDNTSAGNWTIATFGAPDVISGFKAGTQNSVVLPPGGAIILQGRSATSIWSILGASPNILLAQANTWTADQTVSGNVTATGTIHANVDVTAGGNIAAVGNVNGAAVGATGNVNAGVDVGAGRDVSAGRNIAAVGNVSGAAVSATGNVNAGVDVTATRDVTAGRNIAAVGNVNAAAVGATGNVNAGVDIGAGRNIVAVGNVNGAAVGATGNVNAGVDIGAVRDISAGRNIDAAGLVTWSVAKFNQSVYTGSANFTIPTNIFQIEIEAWGAGAGSSGGSGTLASSGGGGGGYGRKLLNVTPGTVYFVTVGIGGTAGVSSVSLPTAGGTSSFGPFLSVTGGSPNGALSLSDPTFTGPGGSSSGGDINMDGAWSFAPFSTINGTGQSGGNGGSAATGGGGGSGNVGSGANGGFPGGGAGGVGATTGAGQNGAHGLVVIRW